MKQGFETRDGKRVDVETAFKNPEHPFRVAIVCAMWLTGFDVECLSTLYIDKPMKAHTLMQAIARANRVYPGKDFGLIVDYNGMLKSLREALAQYALGDDGTGGEEIVAPDRGAGAGAARSHRGDRGASARPRLRSGDADRRQGLRAGSQALADAVEAVYTTRRSQAPVRDPGAAGVHPVQGAVMEPTAFTYAERHDNIEAIYKKLTERRDTADVTELLKELHRIVNEAIRTQAPGRRPGRGLDVRPEPDRPGEAARRVRQEGQAQGDGASGHPRHRRAEAGRDAGAQSAAHGLPAQVRGDRRRLQPREGPDDDRGDLPASSSIW